MPNRQSASNGAADSAFGLRPVNRYSMVVFPVTTRAPTCSGEMPLCPQAAASSSSASERIMRCSTAPWPDSAASMRPITSAASAACGFAAASVQSVRFSARPMSLSATVVVPTSSAAPYRPAAGRCT